MHNAKEGMAELTADTFASLIRATIYVSAQNS